MARPFNRPSNQQRKETHKNSIVHKIANGFLISPINVEYIRHPMERVKGNTYWQGNLQENWVCMQIEQLKTLLELNCKEVIIFEYPKDSKIVYNAEPQK